MDENSRTTATGILAIRGGTVEDHLAITDVLYRYASSIDDLDRDAFADCFTEDGILWRASGEKVRGREALAAIVDAHLICEFTMHNVLNHAYTIEGSVATGRTYCVATLIQGEPDAWTLRNLYIFYHDEIVNEGDRWRIRDRQFVLVAEHEVPIDKFPMETLDRRAARAAEFGAA